MTGGPEHDKAGGRREGGLLFERLVFFSDAVFAIAITLLVLDLRLPAGAIDFSEIGDKVLGFALSFAVIGIYWLNHHRLFGGLKADDAAVRVANLVFLASIAFLPFPTSVIAEHKATSSSVAFYALSVGAVGILLVVLTAVARRPSLLQPGETLGGTVRAVLYSLGTPLVFLGSALAAQANPRFAMQLWWLVLPVLAAATLVGRRVEALIDDRAASRRRAAPPKDGGQG